jgi:hypothetical protein
MTRFLAAFLFMAVAIALPARAAEEPANCEALFVWNADHAEMNDTTLKLKGASRVVTFFCDRPERMAGHLGVEEFMQVVNVGEDNFVENPPNAVLSVIKGDEIVDVVVELKVKPVIDGEDVVFNQIAIIEGEVPVEGGPCSLFIDVIGRPLSPVSVAGVHRRHRRRAIRRCAAGITCY